MESIAFKLIFVAFAVFTVSAVNKGKEYKCHDTTVGDVLT